MFNCKFKSTKFSEIERNSYHKTLHLYAQFLPSDVWMRVYTNQMCMKIMFVKCFGDQRLCQNWLLAWCILFVLYVLLCFYFCSFCFVLFCLCIYLPQCLLSQRICWLICQPGTNTAMANGINVSHRCGKRNIWSNLTFVHITQRKKRHKKCVQN